MDDIVLRTPLVEDLPGDDQRSGENEREHRGCELTGIIHRMRFSVICSNGERGPPTSGSCAAQIICRFFPSAPPSIVDLHPQPARIDLLTANGLRAVARRDRAGAGINEIVAADTGAMAKHQPSF